MKRVSPESIEIIKSGTSGSSEAEKDTRGLCKSKHIYARAQNLALKRSRLPLPLSYCSSSTFLSFPLSIFPAPALCLPFFPSPAPLFLFTLKAREKRGKASRACHTFLSCETTALKAAPRPSSLMCATV